MSFLKKYNICILLFFSGFVSLAQKPDYDHLFSQREYQQAKQGYLKKIEQGVESSALLLKLAYIAEQEGENINAAYYLLKYDQTKADEKVLRHLADLAQKNNWTGYEKNDFNYFILYYRIFAPYLILSLIIIGIYVLAVLLYKKINNQFIPQRHKIITLTYLILLLVFVNISNNYRSIIIKNDQTLIRSASSGAAATLGELDKGNRLSWVSTDDIWVQILWNKQLVYIKESDVLKIE